MTECQEKSIVVGVFNPTSENPNTTISHPGSVQSIKSIVRSRGWSAVDLTTADLEETDTSISKLWTLGINVVILPGGEPRKMREALTPACCRMLSEWRSNPSRTLDHGSGGGGLVCICAGTVVACGKGSRGRNIVEGVELFDDNRFASAGLSGMVRLKSTPDTPAATHPALAFSTTTNDRKKKLRMMYCNGPLMSIKTATATTGRKRSEKEKNKTDCKVSIWANYRTDLAAKCEARRISTEERAFDSIQQNKRESMMLKEKWLCLACGTLHFKSSKIKSCCGMKKREQEKERKLVQELVGVMPGKGAIIAVEQGEKGEENEGTICRTVLFGPHPEFSCKASEDILAESILWASWVMPS